jgi:hypothetical protein
MHPNRIAFRGFSDRNPLMGLVAAKVEKVRANRHPAVISIAAPTPILFVETTRRFTPPPNSNHSCYGTAAAPGLVTGTPMLTSHVAAPAPLFTSHVAARTPRRTPLHPNRLGLSI